MLCQSWPSAVPLPGAVCGIIFLLFLKREISRHLWPLPAPRESRFLFAARGLLVHCVFFLFCFFIPFCKTPLFFKLQAVVVSLWWRIRSSWEKRQFSFSFLRFSNSCGWLRPIASEEYNTDNKAERIENGVNGLVFLFLLEREWKAAVAFLNLQYVSSFVLNICRLSLYH